MGHKVVAVVSDGEEAVQCAGDLHPDLVLINIRLIDAAGKITKLYHIPVVFLTVFIKNCLNKSLQLPEDAVVVTKPLKRDHLEYSISRAVSGYK